MSDLHEAAAEWVVSAFSDRGWDCDQKHADALLAAADQYDVPVELLIQWIGLHREPWTLESWVLWCEKYSHDVERLTLEYALEKDKLEPPHGHNPGD